MVTSPALPDKRPREEPANGFCEAGVAGSWSPSTRRYIDYDLPSAPTPMGDY
ncbi:MAG: hypothetical protein F6K26_15155 [Moorea sp. SIO2I5]|nr:hypothetical protein [Moorena sp. SIO2I5]